MKKISTLLTLGLLTAAGASAAAVMPEMVGQGQSFELTPEAAVKVRASFDKLNSDLQSGTVSPGTVKKIYVDRNGNIFDARFDLLEDPLADQLYFTDDKGNTVQYTFEELPFYWVNYVLYQYDRNGDRVGIISQAMSWPSHYIYDQIFNYDGEPDADGMIPLDKRDFAAVSFSEMCNGTMLLTGVEQTRTFIESMNIWPEFNANNTAFSSFGLLPTSVLGIGSYYSGYSCYTVLNDNTASSVKFSSYDEAEEAATFENAIYLSVNNVNRSILNTYAGGIMVNGFNEKTVYWTPGTIHIFNTGELGSDILEDLDYYPEFWGPLQRYMIWIPGEKLQIAVREEGKPITDDNIGITAKDPDAGLDFSDINYCYSALYSPVGEEPTQSLWRLIEGEVVGEGITAYYSIKPEAYTFVMNGWNFDWSQIDGALMYYHQFPFVPSNLSSIFYTGSTEGTGMRIINDSRTTYIASSKEDIVYHYNPDNISDTRNIPAVGTMELPALENSGINGVIAENGFKVSARNGEISVVAAENGRVNIYSINGQLVKSVNAKAGQTVNVEAAKGLYIVKAGKKAVKVVL